MSTGSKHTNWLGIIALAVICALLGTLGGATVGGALGYVLGRQAVRSELARAGAVTPPQREQNVQPQPLIPPEDWGMPWPEPMPDLGVRAYAQVESIVAGSPAEKAGLRPGDRIVAVDGEALSPRRDLAAVVAGHRVGDRVELTVERGGSQMEVAATLGENPDRPGQAYLGLTYRLAIDVPSRYPSS